jgi:hypothetical protein
MAKTLRDFEMEQMFGKDDSNNKSGHAELHEQCEICGDVKNINNHGLCPFCQLDIDLN